MQVPIWKNVITQLVFIIRIGAVHALIDTGAFVCSILFSVIKALSSFIRPWTKGPIVNFNGEFVTPFGDIDLSIRIQARTFELKNVAVMEHAPFYLTLGMDWLIQHQVSLVPTGNKFDLVFTDVAQNRLVLNTSPVTHSVVDLVDATVVDPVDATVVDLVDATVVDPVDATVVDLVDAIVVDPVDATVVDLVHAIVVDPVDATVVDLVNSGAVAICSGVRESHFLNRRRELVRRGRVRWVTSWKMLSSRAGITIGPVVVLISDNLSVLEKSLMAQVVG